MTRSCLRAFALLVAGCAPVLAAEFDKLAAIDATQVAFRNGVRLSPDPGIDPATFVTRPEVVLVQLPGPVEAATRQRLLALDVTLHDYVDHFTYIASVPEKSWAGLAEMVGEAVVRAVVPYPVEARVDRALRSDSSFELRVDVVLLREPTEDERVALAGLLQIEQETRGALHFVRGVTSSDQVEELAALAPVLWIERYVPGQTQNIEAGMSGAADYLVTLGIDGQGVRVAYDDTGIARTGDTSQCGGWVGSYHTDLGAGRIADEWDFQNSDDNACDDHGHGTHVAGTIGGDGTTDRARAGIAPGVTFLVYKDAGASGSGFGHFDSVLSRAAAHDAAIVGNSWGSGNNTYNSDSYTADQAVRGAYNGSDGISHPMTLSVSTGNNYDLVSAPASAKNVVAVGALKGGNYANEFVCWNTHYCNYSACSCVANNTCGDYYWPATDRYCFSNYGPVDTDGDGNVRVKPDVVAPGTRTFSAAPPYFSGGVSGYAFKDGTSMAQPVVAGTAALMIAANPAYDLQNHPELLKARLLGAANPIGPTWAYGHGLVDALHAVRDTATFQTELWLWSDITFTGENIDYWFPVPAGFREVRVFLTWLDPASMTTEIVDDLDLEVWDGAGSLVGTSSSYDDNVEWVSTTMGVGGGDWWRARIKGWNVPTPPARFGIYAAAILADSAISTSTEDHAFCKAPGQTVVMEQRLQNTGHSAAASEMKLDLPGDDTWFRLDTVTLRTSDPARTATFRNANLKYDPVENTTELMTGLVHPDVPRFATWNVVVGENAPETTHLALLTATAWNQIWYGDSATITVDGTPPSDATNLWSLTHPVGICTDYRRVNMSWTAAWDAGCGLSGYSAHWSEGAPALPDTTADLGPVTDSQSSVRPSHNAMYYNLRSVDTAGNWASSYASYGPIYVDNIPGEIFGLTLQKSGWDLVFSWWGAIYADHYHLWADDQVLFPHPTQVSPDIPGTTLTYTEVGGLNRQGTIWYYLVRGANFCGAEGP